MPIEFPVRVPYTTAPNMVRNTGPLFNIDPDPSYIRQKHQELERHGTDLWAQLPEAATLIGQASRELNLVETTNIVNLALQIQEDVAVMHQGHLAAICFCFPSSWIPGQRVGMSLMSIHEPVADGDRLRSVSQRIAETMADPGQGSFRRHVWTITNSGELSQHPSSKSQHIPCDINELWFRLETQTTWPLGDGETSLFFVNVETVPLIELWQDPEKQKQLQDSIKSMTDAVLTYKNLHHVKSLLCQ